MLVSISGDYDSMFVTKLQDYKFVIKPLPAADLNKTMVTIYLSFLILGTATLDPKSNGMISGVALGYIIATNVMSCIIGIILSVVIKPGSRTSHNVTVIENGTPTSSLQTQDVFADLIRYLGLHRFIKDF